jgi:hypothetical protein
MLWRRPAYRATLAAPKDGHHLVSGGPRRHFNWHSIGSSGRLCVSRRSFGSPQERKNRACGCLRPLAVCPANRPVFPVLPIRDGGVCGAVVGVVLPPRCHRQAAPDTQTQHRQGPMAKNAAHPWLS